MPVTPDTQLPDLLRACPQVRPVLDRYGLRGCGGPHGPAESIRYFAGAHGVDLGRLVSELSAAAADPSAAAAAGPARSFLDELADHIYRRFFLGALAVILTAGAAWGAILLLRIGASGSFTAPSIHEINAHGHAQIFGWVGLFVMGFAYQAFPRMRHVSLWRPDLANISFYLMMFGIAARVLGEPLFRWPILRELAVAGGLAEMVAIALFVHIIVQTIRHSGKPLTGCDGYIIAAIVFFAIQAVYEWWLFRATTSAGSRDEMLGVVANHQAVVRDLQIHGFALLMILGVGIRMFPPLFGLAAPSQRVVRWGLPALLLGVVAEAAGFRLMRITGSHAYGALMYAGMLLLAAASVALTWRWGLWARPTESDRSVKFVRAACTWLHASMLLLVLAPLYSEAVLPAAAHLTESGRHSLAIHFSHAYYGAARHAITVGFISLMILGMAAKVVPTLNGVDIRRLRRLWLPFALVNVGCFLRVTLQIATDFADTAFPLVGVSGVLEVTGIALWAVHLGRLMMGWRPVEAAAARPSRISADDRPAAILQWFPQTLPVFERHGLTPLANPFLRRTLGNSVSLRTVAVMRNMDLNRLLADLNDAAVGEHADRPAQPSQPAHAAPALYTLPVLKQP